MIRRKTTRRRERKGQALLESTLTLLTFLCLVVGVLDCGQFLYLHQSIGERVRNAARVSAIRDYSEAEVKNFVVYGTTTPPDVATTGPFGLRPSNVSVAFEGLNTNANRLAVTISNLEYPVFSPLIAGRSKNLPIRMVVPLERP